MGDHISFVITPVLGLGSTNLLLVTSVSGKVEAKDERFNRVRATCLPRLGYRLFTYITEEQVQKQLELGGQVLENLGAKKVFLRPFGRIPKKWLPPIAGNASATGAKRARP